MGKIETNTLERYLDNELSSKESKRAEKMISDSEASQLFLKQNQKLGDLIRLMDEENTAGVSFDGLSDRILDATRRSPARLPFLERAKVWISEFFEHRRTVWIPAAAIGAAALTLLFLPLSMAPSNGQYYQGDNGIALHSVSSVSGSKIAAVDFGTAEGTTFSLENELGASVGVVWIVEKP